MIVSLPGHAWVLHSTVLVLSPVQSTPPCSGFGESQSRVWSNVPFPQGFVQLVEFFQLLKPPSTKR